MSANISLDSWEMEHLVKEAEESVQCLAREWYDLKLTLESEKLLKRGYVPVLESDLKKLQQEVSASKELLHKLQTAVSTYSQGTNSTYEELENCRSTIEKLQQTKEHLTSRCEILKSECDQERESKLKIQAEVTEASNQLSLQSEYCASMGAVCCTLLWKASQQEDIIPHLLAGSQMKSFIPVVSFTLESFLATYEGEMPENMNEEIQFVLSLVGIVTNVAASAVGREFLSKSSHCKTLVESFSHLLAKPFSKHLIRLKGLAVMGLYNLSINQMGLKVLTGTKGLVPLLTWLLSVESSEEMRLHTLLLLQSLISGPNNIKLLLEVREGMTDTLIKNLTNDKNPEIREISREISQAINFTANMEP